MASNPLFHHDLAHLRDLQYRKNDADEGHEKLLAWRKRIEERDANNEFIAQQEIELYLRASTIVKNAYRSLSYELGITEAEIAAALGEITLPEELLDNLGHHRQHRMGVL